MKRKEKKKYQQRFDVKVRRSKQQKKQREDIYKERTDVSYGPGIAVTMELGKENRKRKKHSGDNGVIKQCRCGSTLHSRTTHRDCPLNNKKTTTNVQTPINKGAHHVITESTVS